MVSYHNIQLTFINLELPVFLEIRVRLNYLILNIHNKKKNQAGFEYVVFTQYI